MEPGLASLQAHSAYTEGLGSDFDPDGFLRGAARGGGQAVGYELAVTFRQFQI